MLAASLIGYEKVRDYLKDKGIVLRDNRVRGFQNLEDEAESTEGTRVGKTEGSEN